MAAHSSSPTVYREIKAFTPGWLAVTGALLAVIAAALAAVHHMESAGHWVTGMTNQIVWGMPHVFAVFLIVAASGALNVASIGSVFGRQAYQPLGRLSGLLAIAMLAGGLAVLVLDLGRPDRLFVAMTHFNFKSIFAWNVILYSGFFAVVGLYLWTMMDWRLKRAYRPAAVLAFGWRLVLTTGTGSIFGFLAARDAYAGAIMAPLFIALSFALGLAVFVLVLAAACAASDRSLSPELLTRMGRLLALFCAANLYFVAVQHVTALYFAGRQGVEGFILWQGGLYTSLFWLGQVVVGGVLPMAVLLRKDAGRGAVLGGAVLVIAGGLAQLFVLIIGGQAFPLQIFPGLEVSSSFQDGAVGTYAPSLAEIVLGLGGVAIAGLIAVIGMSALRFLPDWPSRSAES